MEADKILAMVSVLSEYGKYVLHQHNWIELEMIPDGCRSKTRLNVPCVCVCMCVCTCVSGVSRWPNLTLDGKSRLAHDVQSGDCEKALNKTATFKPQPQSNDNTPPAQYQETITSTKCDVHTLVMSER